MNFEHFNVASAEQAAATLRPCADIDRWIDGLLECRPYPDVERLLARARTVADPFTEAEIDAALAHHPRIGEQAAGESTEAKLSHGEQSGVDADSSTANRIRAQNVSYERAFGRVFLIRAAGRSADDILAELERRQMNTPTVEIAEVAKQLREIAVLRLAGLFA
ncbi:2-oxo-4-hydroxy-4-carboxy-5-ureidoimidazoline decarboxylase [Antrihabitans cavernicola]|uniref:2-oxo-4-hydroxy-4-carboxy-5-ureidoimidazoline decarboxylase n=1 Tax=Antrihabitans cavernicola TaxID=2495913 RepID=A0A5A7S3A7_9NOCA|nr:2-oxo-4-hydroxy-4-carboxy-5-ureidoimidazoline decarboxylase [Spelaeibacter cavernicola]KAA0018067.1 2-oxo-4-hydroxy-4-carboxy-5-ureidoimidazoline decarboxylase [Spelaeibacter cavernicola]